MSPLFHPETAIKGATRAFWTIPSFSSIINKTSSRSVTLTVGPKREGGGLKYVFEDC